MLFAREILGFNSTRAGPALDISERGPGGGGGGESHKPESRPARGGARGPAGRASGMTTLEVAPISSRSYLMYYRTQEGDLITTIS